MTDAIVIGGGINGLVAATLLARHGKSVTLLEAADHLGGMASAGPDGAPRMAHLLYNLSDQVRRDLGMGKKNWPFALEPVPTICLAENGRHVIVEGNTAWYGDGSPHEDAAAFRVLHERLVNYGNVLRGLAQAPPPAFGDQLLDPKTLKQAMQFGKLGLALRKLGKAEIRRFLQVILSNAYDLILDEIPDGPLAGMLAADAVRGLAAGPRAPGTVFNLAYRFGHGGIASRPTDGISAVVDQFASAARQATCRIETRARVSSILFEGDTATGVALEDGRTFEAPLILSSLAPSILAKLTGPGQLDIEATNRIRATRARGTTAKVNFELGDAPEITGLPEALSHGRLILAPSANQVERAFNPSKYGEMSTEPVIEAILSKTGSGQEGRHLSCIVQYAPCDLKGGWTADARSKLQGIVIQALASFMPGLAKNVRGAEVIDPGQIASETGAPGGHWHHAEMTLDQVLTLRPANGMAQYGFGPKGLFLCGASTHPGGDIMGLAGRNAALAALEAEK